MSLLHSEHEFRLQGYLDMETPKDYRKFAEECSRLARRSQNEKHKAILEQMAKVWVRVADEAEQKARRQSS